MTRGAQPFWLQAIDDLSVVFLYFIFIDNHQKSIEKYYKNSNQSKVQGYIKKKTSKKEKQINLLQQTTKRLSKISYYTTI